MNQKTEWGHDEVKWLTIYQDKWNKKMNLTLKTSFAIPSTRCMVGA